MKRREFIAALGGVAAGGARTRAGADLSPRCDPQSTRRPALCRAFRRTAERFIEPDDVPDSKGG
jgi:hypothetical protein